MDAAVSFWTGGSRVVNNEDGMLKIFYIAPVDHISFFALNKSVEENKIDYFLFEKNKL